MSSTLPTITARAVPESNHRETMIEFARWAVAQLELESSEHNGALRVQVPEQDQANFAGESVLTLPLDSAAGLDAHVEEWLLQQLHALGPAVNVRPADQPTAVNDIAQRLFAAYQVDGGRVHLGGCQLVDYPFLRLTFVAPGKDQSEVRHLFVAHDGSSVSEKLASDLGLLEIEPLVGRPPRIEDAALQALIAAGRRVAAQSVSSRDPDATTGEPAIVSVVWVKHASGNLNFTIDDATVSLPFSGWTKLITAKPYTSPKSGSSGFHLAATDDGRIDVAEQITPCEQSGRRVLRQELVTCGVTGKHVLAEFTETCPVSGEPCLVEEFAPCSVCQQPVSKAVLKDNICQACRRMVKISKDDPRLVWILGEHTGLDRWKHWQLAETKSVYIVLATSWTKRLLAVVDKESLAVHHLATAGKFGTLWVPVDEPVRAEILQ